MESVCICFQFHHPLHTRWYWPREGYTSELDLDLYFDMQKNLGAFRNLCIRSYIPTIGTLLRTIENDDGKYTLNISGTFLEQCRLVPEIRESLQELASYKNVEFTCSPYYNSISSLFHDMDFFKKYVRMHKRAIKKVFDHKASVFINSDLITTYATSSIIGNMGFTGMMTEGAKNLLNGRLPSHLFHTDGLLVMMRHIDLSEDIEKRFSTRGWIGYPLVPEKFTTWINNIQGDVITLYIDCGTFGGHSQAGSGIFDFFEQLPAEMKKRNIDMITLSEAMERFEAENLPTLQTESVARYGISNLLGNHMQHVYFNELVDIGTHLKDISDPMINGIYGHLQQVDILSSMNSHNVPISFDKAVNNFSILSDLKRRLIQEDI